MKLLFQEQEVELGQIYSTEEVIEKINELLQENFYLSHIVVDGEDVLEDPEIYLARNINDIDSIEIIAVAAKEFINELLLSAEEYVERANPHITALADEFYNNPNSTNWDNLSQLFEGIQWLLSMIKTVDQSIVRPSGWNEVLAGALAIQDELSNLEEALINIDSVLIADMLQYEILPNFESFSVEIRKIIDTEGIRHDLN